MDIVALNMKSSIFDIRKAFPYDIFDYQALVTILSHYKKPRDRITTLIKQGMIIRIKKGLYSFGKDLQKHPVCLEYIANLIYGPSYISMEYALSCYGLIPERVYTITSVTVKRTRYFETPLGNFYYKAMNLRLYSGGAGQINTGEISYLIAPPEKALTDMIWNDKRLKNPSISDIEAYLLYDLRIDREHLLQLRDEQFVSILHQYNSVKIRNLYKCIKKMRTKKHA